MTTDDPRDDYLFDGTGVPDPHVERLERLLRPLGAADVVPAPAPRPPRGRLLAIAALLASAAAVVVVALRVGGPDEDPARAPVADGAVAEGSWIETHDAERLLRLGEVSRVVVQPRSRLQVRRLDGERQHLYLARGAIEATVSADARPRFFQVATDAANCVDLGCRYVLGVADDGTATVRVTSGQVAFETPAREVFIPAGATAVARPGTGPGTPRFEDASAPLREAFERFDAATGAERRAAALAALDAVRGPRDTLPAWHLLQEPDEAVVRAAAARIEAVAGACDVPSDGSAADARAAWKAYLFGRCW
jgi:hypothetical protein